MADMLVRLYDLPEVEPLIKKLAAEGIVIRRPQPWDQGPLRRFCEEHFSEDWADESNVGFANKPISLFIAQEGKRIVGFSAYECTRRDFAGPIGVAENYRGRGIGAALLLACLHAMGEMGYAYAIIGGAGPKDFYRRVCGATIISGSTPGIYGYEWLE